MALKRTDQSLVMLQLVLCTGSAAGTWVHVDQKVTLREGVNEIALLSMTVGLTVCKYTLQLSLFRINVVAK